MTVVDIRTMVFSRNLVAHLDALREFGCLACRGAKAAGCRVASLLTEVHLTPQSGTARLDGGVLEIPGEIFVNWRSGPRALVPTPVTRRRARNLLAKAGRTGGVAHFWLHPENIATRPSMLVNFAAVVEEIARARDDGKLRVQIQLQHSLALLPQSQVHDDVA